MDWIGLQLIGAALMFGCYLYADRRRLYDLMRRGYQQIARVILASMNRVRRLLDHFLPIAAQVQCRQTPTLDLHAPANDGTAPASDWLRSLNHYPDRYPHILIIGPTGSGKTSFTMALLAYRTGRIAVLTPKPDPDDWPGVPIATIDDDGAFNTLSREFVALDREVKDRLVASKHRRPIADTLTIVCDDWPVLASECGRPAADLFKLVGRLGRSLQVRLIVLSQSKQIKALGLDGEGDAVTNFTRITLTSSHSATIHLEQGSLALDTRLVPQLAQQTANPQRWWRNISTDEVEASGNADWLLQDTLRNNGRNDATLFARGVVPIATPETSQTDPIAQQGVASANEAESLPPDVAQRIASIDWRSIAELVVHGTVGETAALKSLGFPPSSTSAKYKAAKARLQAARQILSDTS